MKKLLIILKSLQGGGIEKITLRLIDALQTQSSVEIVVVVTKPDGELFDDFESRLPIINLDTSYEARLKALGQLTVKLKHCFQQQKPQVILSQLPGLNFVTLIAWKLSGVSSQVFLSEHTLPLHQLLKLENSGKMGLIGKINPILGGLLYPLANKVIAVSHGIAQELESSFKLRQEKLQVIYNPVVDDHLATQAALPIEHPWFETGEPPVFLAVGRLAKQKDYPTLLNAFAKVCQTYEVRLLILGEGELRKNLETLIKNLNIENNVDMPGFVTNPYGYMARAAALILSSIWEVLPTVLIEALACGCAVVSTDCDYGPREILNKGEHGKLVPVGDIDALAEAMENTINHPLDCQNLRVYAQKFSVDKAIDRYKKILAL